MSIEREIQKDISKYEAKLIGPFTTRQVIFGIPGIVIGVGSYFLLKPYLGEDIVMFVAMVLALPLLLCGWAKPYGIPFEKYVAIVFVSQVLAPKHRKYVTENPCPELQEQNSLNQKKKEKKKKTKVSYSGEYQQFL